LLRTREGYGVVDFKSGQLSAESEAPARRQLHWYALVVGRFSGVPAREVRVSPMFLGAGAEVDLTPADPGLLAEVEADIVRMGEETTALLRGGSRKYADQAERFAMTDDLSVCAGCVFRACPGWGRGR
jgi:hypothetical protein